MTGDFNAVPDSDEIRWLMGMTTLDGRRVAYQDAWARANAVGSGGTDRAGITWASMNPYVGLMHWLRPDRRLDYIFATPVGAIAAAASTARASCSTSRARPRRAERVFISDHFGVIADIQMVAEPPHAAP